MINFELAQKTFKDYLQNYNLEDGKIALKVNHTFCVINASEYISKELSLDNQNLDIFRVRLEDSIENVIDNCSKEILENSTISENIFNDFMNNKLILSTDRKTPMDFWVSGIAYIFDFYFSCSLNYVKNMDYINKIVDRFDYKNAEAKEKMEIIRKHAIEFIENSLKKTF